MGRASVQARAWAALGAPLEKGPSTAMAAAQRAAPVSSASGPKCWTCGTRGHRQHECPQSQKGADNGKGKWQSSDDGLGARMDRLEKLMEQTSKQLLAKKA